jgi:hypothetical protein
MENEELKALLDTLVGKTIAKWEFVDKPVWGNDEPSPYEGVHLHFTDGTEFTVYEGGQAGYIEYQFEDAE